MQHYKIICISQIYNELEKENLKRFVKYVSPLCEALIVYDDGSTDGSYEYMQKVTPHVIKGEKNDFENEMYHKQLLIERAKALSADFIFYLDADEVLTAKSYDDLQKLANLCIEKNIDGLQFHKINLWRSSSWQRIDSLFDIGWFTHFWRVTPEMMYENIRRGLHQSPYPSTVKKVEKVDDIAVLHYGFATEKNIAYKYLTYKAFGQRGYIMLDRLISEDKLHIKKVPIKLFPRELYIKNEPKPQKKKFLESLLSVEKYRKKITYPKKAELPLVTIITPVYNADDYIEETIQSIIAQDYPNVEYLIVNDGSTDKTSQILSKYSRKIIIINQKNSGEASAVNNGLTKAKGKYIMIVNADDPLLPGAISTAVTFMEKHKDVVVGYPDWYMIDSLSKVISSVKVLEYNYLKMVKDHYCYIGPGAIINTKAFELAGYRDPTFKYVGDFEFWLRLGMVARFARIPDILATWRLHPHSASEAKRGKEMAEEHIRLTKEILAQKELPKYIKKFTRSISSASYYHAASLHNSCFSKYQFYVKSLIYDPFMFARKFRYEMVKIKHYLTHTF